jgi:hypothetical protein
MTRSPNMDDCETFTVSKKSHLRENSEDSLDLTYDMLELEVGDGLMAFTYAGS